MTQIALGATIGEAAFRKNLGGKAPVVGGLCGLLPDLDLFVAGDDFARMVTHRGSSHSLLVLPLVALLVGWLAWRWAKKQGRYRDWVHLCFWGLITHPLLDVFTTYGTQLLAPFDRTRFAIDGASIIDPLYSLPLLLTCALAARSNRARARKVARVALVISTLYLCLGTWNSWLVEQRARAYFYSQASVIRATPTFFNCIVFRVVVTDVNGDVHTGVTNAWIDRGIRFRHHLQSHHPDVNAILNSEQGKILSWFSGPSLQAEAVGVDEAAERRSKSRVDLNLYGWRKVQDGGGVANPPIRFWDRKYGLFRSDISPFAYEGQVHADGSVSLKRLEGMRDTVDVGSELSALWQLLTRGELSEP